MKYAATKKLAGVHLDGSYETVSLPEDIVLLHFMFNPWIAGLKFI